MTVNGVGGNGNVDPNLVKESGVQFGEDTLKSLKRGSIMNKNDDGTMVRETQYEAVLSNGTMVFFPRQNKGAKITCYDNECDFEKLKNARIFDTDESDTYNLMGCQFSTVTCDYDKERDYISIGNHEDGTKSNGNEVFVRKEDAVHIVGKIYYPADVEEGVIGESAGLKYGFVTKREYRADGTVVSHDGKLLKDSYVNAEERKMPDGYTIKTSPDRKEEWYFDPQGKSISIKEFANAKHPYKVNVPKK